MLKFRQVFFYPSSLILILVNTIPLWGVLFFDWNIFTIIILYWMESAAVGFFNVLKMEKINNYKFTALLPFFIVHYVIFMFVHLFFIMKFFQPELESASGQFKAFEIVFKYLESLFISLSFIFLSHGISFVFNFIKKQEFKNIGLRAQMFMPYKRIVIMQVLIMFIGGGLVYADYDKTGSALVFLVVLKIAFDLIAHIFEHRQNIFK